MLFSSIKSTIQFILKYVGYILTLTVRILGEGHKIWKNLPLKIWHHSVTSKWMIFSNFVAFSEYPNFILTQGTWTLEPSGFSDALDYLRVVEATLLCTAI